MEGHFIMVEILTVGVRPIMTGHTVSTEIKHMPCYKSWIYMIVADGAGVLIESGVNLGMTIVAAKRRSITF
jgi:hypothetical protein